MGETNYSKMNQRFPIPRQMIGDMVSKMSQMMRLTKNRLLSMI